MVKVAPNWIFVKCECLILFSLWKKIWKMVSSTKAGWFQGSSLWRCSNSLERIWKSAQLYWHCSFFDCVNINLSSRWCVIYTVFTFLFAWALIHFFLHYLFSSSHTSWSVLSFNTQNTSFRNITILGYLLDMKIKGFCCCVSRVLHHGVFISLMLGWPSAKAQRMLQGQMVFVCSFLSTTAPLAGQPPLFRSPVSLLRIFLMPLKNVVIFDPLFTDSEREASIAHQPWQTSSLMQRWLLVLLLWGQCWTAH